MQKLTNDDAFQNVMRHVRAKVFNETRALEEMLH